MAFLFRVKGTLRDFYNILSKEKGWGKGVTPCTAMKSRWNPRKKGREAAGGWVQPVVKQGGTEESVLIQQQ